MKKISIITPCYNSEFYLREAYKAVSAQSHSNWEWIIADDCSTDNSWNILNEFKSSDSRVKIFKNSRNSGAAVTRNNCLNNATGDYVAFLDSDDLWSPDKLEKQIRFSLDNDIDYTYHNYWTIDSEGKQLKEQLTPPSIEQVDLYKFNPFATSSIMIKRSVIESNHIRFRNHLRRRQDYFFWFDTIGVSNKAQGLNELLSSYRIFGGDSLSANKKKMALIQWQLYRTEFNLNIIQSFYYFVFYAIHGIKKYFI